MRKIKFRGQTGTTEGEKWVFGYYYKVKSFFNDNENHYISTIRSDHLQDYNIDESTLGQYTRTKRLQSELKYMNGDIVKYKSQGCPFEQISEVKWVENDGYIRCGYSPLCDNFFDNGLNATDFQVIGNIYDNPELLEKGN